ncbi:fungal Zn, 2-cys(6) binuclear cluster domain protein [Rhizoctonia solani AG-3 Rhs1AP]|uniref:Fungal Zn, 2-cys(6) binuclear cluster domain protein n=2 Tax=Rhizoctonia solani AG-3 TaxID=1086053 RepID=A0A074S263_9AGAM|nr:fungal Zn, 2-cys(6) binuclear cluster domain protein [Rhizoctonia solani AG-3 Rhs1AP]KEP50993.1 fungal Zn, 2-cys(6) binuclear cluster domain protein [Rhizoctonia solani 123E]
MLASLICKNPCTHPVSTMSQSEAGPSRRRRKYASQACNVCRRRRTKCDGTQPTCEPCTISGHECSWTADSNESNRPVTKQYLEGLRAKIQMLESEIALLEPSDEHTMMASSSNTQPTYDLALTPTMMSSSITPSKSHSPNTQSFSLAQYVNQTPPQTHLSLLHDDYLPPQDPLIQPAQYSLTHEVIVSGSDDAVSASAYQYIFNIDSSITLEEQSPEHRASMVTQWNRYLPELGLIQLSRHEHDTLLFRGFSYGAAWLLGMLPDLFLRDMLEFLRPNSTRARGELQYYSPLLHCSLLAFASPFSDDPGIRARTTRERFATHAKQWLDEEFSYSNPSLILSLILLSEYHLGIGEINTGHMYLGMSIRAARTRSGPSSLARGWFHWSTFIQEKLRALDMQRPSEMPEPHVPIVPPIAIRLSGRSTAGNSIEDVLTHTDYAGISAHCFMQNVKLVLISSTIPNVLQSGSAPIDLHLQLDTWFNSLPDGLLIRQRATLTQPPILALHIRYWWSILNLHLPFVNSSDHIAGQSVKMCNRATEKLVKLFGAYDTQFGFQYFPRNLLKVCFRSMKFTRE